jgi:hypothetical protein
MMDDPHRETRLATIRSASARAEEAALMLLVSKGIRVSAVVGNGSNAALPAASLTAAVGGKRPFAATAANGC